MPRGSTRSQTRGVPRQVLADRRQHQPRRSARATCSSRPCSWRRPTPRSRREANCATPRLAARSSTSRSAPSRPHVGFTKTTHVGLRRCRAMRCCRACIGSWPDNGGTALSVFARVPAAGSGRGQDRNRAGRAASTDDTALFVAFAPAVEPAVRRGGRRWRRRASAARPRRRSSRRICRACRRCRRATWQPRRGRGRLMAAASDRRARLQIPPPRPGTTSTSRCSWRRWWHRVARPADDLLDDAQHRSRRRASTRRLLREAAGDLRASSASWRCRHRVDRLPGVPRLRAGDLYAAAMVLLLAVLTPLGSSVRGTQAWFELGPFQLQPSELAKLAVIIAGAAYARAAPRRHRRQPGRHADRDRRRRRWGSSTLQPDLGTAPGVRVVLMAMLPSPAPRPATSSCPLLGVDRCRSRVVQLGVLKDYQLDRLTAFLDRRRDNAERGVQPGPVQDRHRPAASPGRACSRAPRPTWPTCPSSTPTSSSRWSARSSASSAPRCCSRCSRWSCGAPGEQRPCSNDLFGTLVCVGVLAMFVFQIFENIGMTMGIMPITGHPAAVHVLRRLGSIITTFACIGLVVNIHMRRFTCSSVQGEPSTPARSESQSGWRGSASNCIECQACGRGSSRSWPGWRSPLATSGWSGAPGTGAHRRRRRLAPRLPRHLRDRPAQPGAPDPLRDPQRTRRRAWPSAPTRRGSTSRPRCGPPASRCSRSTPTGRPATSTSSPSTSRPSSSTRTSSTASTSPACRCAPRTAADEDPLVVAGGHCTFNPEPLADFVDAFVIGDGEEVVGEITEVVSAWNASRRPAPRACCTTLAHVPGVYVPVDVRRRVRRPVPRGGHAAVRRRPGTRRQAHRRRPRGRGRTRSSSSSRSSRSCTTASTSRSSAAARAAAASARPG